MAQLDAGRRYAGTIDADWVPGEPVAQRAWSVETAWEALLQHLGAYGASVRAGAEEIVVVHHSEETVYRFTPGAWADYLNEVEAEPAEDDTPEDRCRPGGYAAGRRASDVGSR